jgi:biopolymer transport protein ExbD
MRTHGHVIEHDGELNILPYLDVLMNLIIFMLLSMTGLASYGVINATTAGATRGDSIATEQVRVEITDAGFLVRRGDQAIQLDGRDFARLTSTLESIKSGDLDTRATLTAAPSTSFETVTATLDAMRGAAGHPLYPDVALDRS